VALSTRQKIAIAHAAYRGLALLGRGPHVTTRRRGVWWQLDLREGIDLALYLGVYEPTTARVLARLAHPGATVLDIGANVGAHTLPLARAVGPRGRVLAFEPTAFAHGKLRHNLLLNPELAGRVSPERTMLTDGELVETLYSGWPVEGGDALHALHGGRAETTTGASARRLDDVLAERGVEHVDLVKLDVDGYECHVLGGAPRLLAAGPPIVMELAPYVLEERGRSLAELLGLLSAAGYRLSDEKTGRPLPTEPAAIERLIPRGSSRNAIARR
jgi:FkbM family methyltransferase